MAVGLVSQVGEFFCEYEGLESRHPIPEVRSLDDIDIAADHRVAARPADQQRAMRSNCVVHSCIRQRGARPEGDHGRGLAPHFWTENVVPPELVVRRRLRPRGMCVQPIPRALYIRSYNAKAVSEDSCLASSCLFFVWTAAGSIDDMFNIACFAVLARQKTADSRANGIVFWQSLVLRLLRLFAASQTMQ